LSSGWRENGATRLPEFLETAMPAALIT
jgi:hypothetical protein